MLKEDSKSSGSIIIPTLNIENSIEPLVEKIFQITRDTEKVNIMNPFSGLRCLPELSKCKKKIQDEYDHTIKKCYDLLAEPVQGPGMVMAFSQAWSTAKGLSAVTKLQEAWRNVDALLDRKYAYSIAVLSIYIAVISFILTVLSLF